MKEVIVDVAKDFSDTPGGRFRSDGDFSGEAFRQDVLEPLLDQGKSVTVDLDGPVGFTSSFLEEVFGGLVRKYSPKIIERVRIRAAGRPSRREKAETYVQRAVASYSARGANPG